MVGSLVIKMSAMVSAMAAVAGSCIERSGARKAAIECWRTISRRPVVGARRVAARRARPAPARRVTPVRAQLAACPTPTRYCCPRPPPAPPPSLRHLGRYCRVWTAVWERQPRAWLLQQVRQRQRREPWAAAGAAHVPVRGSGRAGRAAARRRRRWRRLLRSRLQGYRAELKRRPAATAACRVRVSHGRAWPARGVTWCRLRLRAALARRIGRWPLEPCRPRGAGGWAAGPAPPASPTAQESAQKIQPGG
eukprot:scaffold3009_cov108-Isochrysis_galbana.AAC.7